MPGWSSNRSNALSISVIMVTFKVSSIFTFSHPLLFAVVASSTVILLINISVYGVPHLLLAFLVRLPLQACPPLRSALTRRLSRVLTYCQSYDSSSSP